MQTSDASHFFRTETDLARSQARAQKAQQNRHLGEAINLIGKILYILVTEKDVWSAEGGHIIRQTCLLTNMTLRFFRGHTGPVTCLLLYESGSTQTHLISGSWDKTIKVWDVVSKKVLSSTQAHADFVKCMVSVPPLKLLVSGSSDKTARLWDLSPLDKGTSSPLRSLGSLLGHTRPIDCLAYDESNGRLFTGDSMGVIKMWNLEIADDRSCCKATVLMDIKVHRIGVNSIDARNGYLWSASTDGSVLFHNPSAEVASTPSIPARIEHKGPVKSMLQILVPSTETLYLITSSEDIIHIFDVGSFAAGEGEAELLGTIDAHSDIVTGLRLWMRQPMLEKRDPDDYDRIIRTPSGLLEPWIVSSSLDGTVRKWRLASYTSAKEKPSSDDKRTGEGGGLRAAGWTAEEERELDELLESD